jgi:cytochrome b subunit of formate dehydrogenase
MDGNLNSMTTGSVDVSRVRVHHDLWMQEREATGLDVAEAPRTQPEAARGKTVSEHPA